jgi:hypothetical protein
LVDIFGEIGTRLEGLKGATETTPEGVIRNSELRQYSATTGSAKANTFFHGVDDHWYPPQIQSHLDGPDWC